MKKALLCFCSIACLTVAGLYAYASFNRDPLVVAASRISKGMPLESVIVEVGEEPASSEEQMVIYADTNVQFTAVELKWSNENCVLQVRFRDRRVESHYVSYRNDTAMNVWWERLIGPFLTYS